MDENQQYSVNSQQFRGVRYRIVVERLSEISLSLGFLELISHSLTFNLICMLEFYENR